MLIKVGVSYKYHMNPFNCVVVMTEVKVKVPDDLKKQMERADFIDWSKVARDSFREKLTELSMLENIASKSELTEEEAKELGAKVNHSLHKRYKKLYSDLE